jgi:hypothetical protein
MTHRQIQRIVNDWDYGATCTLMSDLGLEKFRHLNFVAQGAVKNWGSKLETNTTIQFP